MGKQFIAALSDETEDVVAALEWLETRPELDAGRTAIVGHSFGTLVSLLASARTPRLRAGVSFAGPSQTWSDAPALQETMLAAIEQLTIPFFLIQAQNDHSLLPTYTLGTLLVCSQERRWPAARESDRHRVREASGKMAVWSVLAPALTRFHSPGPTACGEPG